MTIESNKNININPGYVFYKYDHLKNTLHFCIWFLYPVFRCINLLSLLKFKLYRKLNKLGIMKTQEGCRMCLSDIWSR